jgi:phosphate transport system permease protein
VVFSPKSDAVFATDAQGRINGWEVDNPHPETSWRTLFGKVYYEGQADSQFTWQSTGGSDDFEPKFSLTPLIFGTLKGTFYALLFAVPLALFAAFYTAQFMHPAYRNIVKPVIEIMAAVPSVVLGFFAALWLAPRIERLLPGLAIFPFLLAVLVLLGVVAFDTLPRRVKSRCKPGGEIVILMILVVVGGTAAFYIGDGIGNGPMAGDPQAWLRRVLGVSYDQRNSLVVGLAMGFAVTPLIFTISEDSLSNVPAHLKATSLALGATPWQTALRVILPTASPGIFSAVMIGFGRAVGETMIVLMATGNTPILDLNIFNGFRALAPNIAVELPEAPVDGTLYRVLFLAALILFFMTFAVNTVAEWVRLRLRERYRVL